MCRPAILLLPSWSLHPAHSVPSQRHRRTLLLCGSCSGRFWGPRHPLHSYPLSAPCCDYRSCSQCHRAFRRHTQFIAYRIFRNHSCADSMLVETLNYSINVFSQRPSPHLSPVVRFSDAPPPVLPAAHQECVGENDGFAINEWPTELDRTRSLCVMAQQRLLFASYGWFKNGSTSPTRILRFSGMLLIRSKSETESLSEQLKMTDALSIFNTDHGRPRDAGMRTLLPPLPQKRTLFCALAPQNVCQRIRRMSTLWPTSVAPSVLDPPLPD